MFDRIIIRDDLRLIANISSLCRNPKGMAVCLYPRRVLTVTLEGDGVFLDRGPGWHSRGLLSTGGDDAFVQIFD